MFSTPKHFLLSQNGPLATVTLNRPEKKNPLTFDSYRELRDTFYGFRDNGQIKAVIITGAAGNFCSGGDVHEIIGPLTKMTAPQLLDFTRLTCDLIRSIMSAPQTVIAAIDGVCVGAGAAIAMASDLRYGTASSKVAFLFTKVGLSGADMGACSILPRIIGLGRAQELLYTGRSMSGEEALAWGFYSKLIEPGVLLSETTIIAQAIATGPTFAHRMTKKMLQAEWQAGLEEALEAEAQAQAVCMQTSDFTRAYNAFVAKEKPVFKGD